MRAAPNREAHPWFRVLRTLGRACRTGGEARSLRRNEEVKHRERHEDPDAEQGRDDVPFRVADAAVKAGCERAETGGEEGHQRLK